MVDFRKWLLALAVVGLLLGIGSSSANAQDNTTFTCQATAGVPNITACRGNHGVGGRFGPELHGRYPDARSVQPIPLTQRSDFDQHQHHEQN